ncbi:MAG: hypothetical protein M1826_007260 [Phylliscum demangeonii]|nr:MAG: hypothetical protein M1826_007260 [Phylliscum demangeonii]
MRFRSSAAWAVATLWFVAVYGVPTPSTPGEGVDGGIDAEHVPNHFPELPQSRRALEALKEGHHNFFSSRRGMTAARLEKLMWAWEFNHPMAGEDGVLMAQAADICKRPPNRSAGRPPPSPAPAPQKDGLSQRLNQFELGVGRRLQAVTKHLFRAVPVRALSPTRVGEEGWQLDKAALSHHWR